MIQKIEVHRYTLKPRSLLAAKTETRAGALLRVTFSNLEVPGVSDLFPWAQFGDPALEEWFAELKTLDPSSKTLRLAIEAAHHDAIASSRGQPLVQGSIVNHWLATDPVDLAVGDVIEARRSTSPAIKIKIGHRDPLAEAAALSRLVSHWGPLRLRLDANERMTRDDLSWFLGGLPILIRQAIEFIEDPFAFDLREWSDFHRETGIALAYDRGAKDRELGPGSDLTSRSGAAARGVALADVFDSGAAQVLIHKPAWQDEDRAVFARARNLPVVVTSILGHPVGNLWAASRAHALEPNGVHGCKSHVVYRDDEASTVLVKSKQVRGSRVVGLGVGLGLQSKWFSRLKWEPLA